MSESILIGLTIADIVNQLADRLGKPRPFQGENQEMKFDLVTPCKSCPFRTDVASFLTPARAREIIHAITALDQTFTCHKTVDYERMPEDADDYLPGDKDQHCAGAAIFLEKQGRANQMMRIAERIGFYDRSKLRMDAPVFDTGASMVAHMRKKTRVKELVKTQNGRHQ